MERFLYGAFGSLLPDVVLFWSKRYTAPLLTFDLAQYAVVVAVYAAAAGIVARVFPYRGGYTQWKAVVVGVTLPFIVSGLIAAADRAGQAGELVGVELRGPDQGEARATVRAPGELVDLLAAF